ncbi:adhesion G-protein coupled receptor F1-like [Eucyclogobius newberryi]|uniref:adhesion G-protein coupled receptor F1-like n=1 Tax=Eucyclogobius newberryi TaxID=166745 RepID=UPI003B5B901D
MWRRPQGCDRAAQPISKVIDYFYGVEFQQRGSPHCHALCRLENNPKRGVNTDEEVINFVDQYITCPASGQISLTVKVTECPARYSYTCEVKDYPQFNKEITLEFELLTVEPACDSEEFGPGNEGDQVIGSCEEGKTGGKVFTCLNKTWVEEEDNCVLTQILQLLRQTQDLKGPAQVPQILEELNDVTNELQNNVTESPATMEAIVTVMEGLAHISQTITHKSMKDILNTSSILTTDETKTSWERLNNKTYKPFTRRSAVNPRIAASSRFLNNIEMFADKYVDRSGFLATDLISFHKTVFSDSFDGDYNGSVPMQIPESGQQDKEMTVLTFESLHNVLPPIDKYNSTHTSINAKVVLVQSKGVDNVTFKFDLQKNSFFWHQCVFWNFSLWDNSGGWDDEGCTLVHRSSSSVVCQCNHLTSFSVLSELDYYKILIVFLVICLIIEAVVWKKIRKSRMSYMRHVSIVNVAVSLLCGEIWLLIDVLMFALENKPLCTAATFFTHFFYLALFFWMLASGLLLLHRSISIVQVRRGTMLAIGFSIGYGAPLIIAVVTIAVTGKEEDYTLHYIFLLHKLPSEVVLAFVFPALTVVAINFFILCVFSYKLFQSMKSTNEANADEKPVLVEMMRWLAFLAPFIFFGLTWCLGLGVMLDKRDDDTRYCVCVSFAVFNSSQGLFLLLFGTLLDKKVRQELKAKSTCSVATRNKLKDNSI